jgi:hypothetical protein
MNFAQMRIYLRPTIDVSSTNSHGAHGLTQQPHHVAEMMNAVARELLLAQTARQQAEQRRTLPRRRLSDLWPGCWWWWWWWWWSVGWRWRAKRTASHNHKVVDAAHAQGRPAATGSRRLDRGGASRNARLGRTARHRYHGTDLNTRGQQDGKQRSVCSGRHSLAAPDPHPP